MEGNIYAPQSSKMGTVNIDNTANSDITAYTSITGITGNKGNITNTARKSKYNFDG